MSTTIERTETADLATGLDLEQLTTHIGAVVRGVRLSGDLSPATAAALTEALHRHKVLFFRGQDHLNDAGQEAFAARMGVPEPHPTAPLKDGTKAVWALDSADGVRANSWHTDITFIPDIPYASILRAEVLPDLGGDTLWANTCAAYRRLPSPLRAFADAARALHSNIFDYAPTVTDIDRVGSQYRSMQSRRIETDHSVVHVIPETGERALLLGHFFRNFIGMTQAESLAFYNALQTYVTRPEHCVRWRWSPGDVAMWDNRSTQHYGVNDYDERRVLNRVSLRGKPVVDINGAPSRLIDPA